MCPLPLDLTLFTFTIFRDCREVPSNVGQYDNFRGGERLRSALARMMERTFMGVKVRKCDSSLSE